MERAAQHSADGFTGRDPVIDGRHANRPFSVSLQWLSDAAASPSEESITRRATRARTTTPGFFSMAWTSSSVGRAPGPGDLWLWWGGAYVEALFK